MNIILKTKEDLLKEGWTEELSGSLVNSDFGDDAGYLSRWFINQLGREFKVVDYMINFYVCEPSCHHAFIFPKTIVKSVEYDSKR